MALTAQPERQSWFCTKEELNNITSSQTRVIESLRRSNKHRGEVVIKLNKEIISLRKQLEESSQSSVGYESFGELLADH